MAAILTQRANVTTSEAVTITDAVTQEIADTQRLSPLSPLSLVLFLAIHARGRSLGVPGVTGDGTGAADWKYQSHISQTGGGQNLPQSQINILKCLMWFWRAFLHIDLLKCSICNGANMHVVPMAQGLLALLPITPPFKFYSRCVCRNATGRGCFRLRFAGTPPRGFAP